ncbi:kelch domain-containing protein family protein [Thecamonas trahens ATCC 50062]|uniref:Kelch domain-containing protein family protein n=1 Tax=Thecamonas trahens ATCC 50062 TaxID=461836 RepID=A0A0L0D7C5_THETB|nr:kelch domain-containing protein family protein [Thecamonas trahens ATCC 50062]KNC47991.1 kelch domain-containing protein family protein [Thecamonas trahens ATCC 50062]|eukprot:XP_013759008.1 kelch domain-containing protein family protein [Thecamonas trahens ATCC 50062]
MAASTTQALVAALEAAGLPRELGLAKAADALADALDGCGATKSDELPVAEAAVVGVMQALADSVLSAEGKVDEAESTQVLHALALIASALPWLATRFVAALDSAHLVVLLALCEPDGRTGPETAEAAALALVGMASTADARKILYRVFSVSRLRRVASDASPGVQVYALKMLAYAAADVVTALLDKVIAASEASATDASYVEDPTELLSSADFADLRNKVIDLANTLMAFASDPMLDDELRVQAVGGLSFVLQLGKEMHHRAEFEAGVWAHIDAQLAGLEPPPPPFLVSIVSCMAELASSEPLSVCSAAREALAPLVSEVKMHDSLALLCGTYFLLEQLVYSQERRWQIVGLRALLLCARDASVWRVLCETGGTFRVAALADSAAPGDPLHTLAVESLVGMVRSGGALPLGAAQDALEFFAGAVARLASPPHVRRAALDGMVAVTARHVVTGVINATAGVEPDPAGETRGASVTLVGTKMYVFGGELADGSRTNMLRTLDVVSGAWEVVEAAASSSVVPAVRTRHAAARVGHTLYIHGGLALTSTPTSYLHAFDTVTREWREVECVGKPLPPRTGHTLTGLHDPDALVVVGGYCDGYKYNDVWVLALDVEDDGRVRSALSMITGNGPTLRDGHATLEASHLETGSSGRKLIVTGGFTLATHGDSYLLDLGHRTWTKLGESGRPRAAHAAFWTGPHAFGVFGGWSLLAEERVAFDNKPWEARADGRDEAGESAAAADDGTDAEEQRRTYATTLYSEGRKLGDLALCELITDKWTSVQYEGVHVVPRSLAGCGGLAGNVLWMVGGAGREGEAPVDTARLQLVRRLETVPEAVKVWDAVLVALSNSDDEDDVVAFADLLRNLSVASADVPSLAAKYLAALTVAVEHPSERVRQAVAAAIASLATSSVEAADATRMTGLLAKPELAAGVASLSPRNLQPSLQPARELPGTVSEGELLIHAGLTGVVSFTVDVADTVFLYSFSLAALDIDFAVYWRSSELTEDMAVVPLRRVPAAPGGGDVVYDALLVAPVPGVYSFKWSNHYSWMTGKTVRYRIKSFVPEVEAEAEAEAATEAEGEVVAEAESGADEAKAESGAENAADGTVPLVKKRKRKRKKRARRRRSVKAKSGGEAEADDGETNEAATNIGSTLPPAGGSRTNSVASLVTGDLGDGYVKGESEE